MEENLQEPRASTRFKSSKSHILEGVGERELAVLIVTEWEEFNELSPAVTSLFQVSDTLHHEVIAVSLWCLAFGILIGTHAGKGASDTRKQ